MEQEGRLPRQPRISHAHVVEPVRVEGRRGLARRQPTPCRDQQHRGQHGDQQEVRLPAERDMQLAADHRRQRRTEAHRHANPGHHAGALGTAEQVLDHGPSHHHAGGAAGALQHARRDQRRQVRRQRGQQRADPGHRQPDHQDALAAMAIRQRPIQQLQRAVGDQVAAQRQLHAGLFGAEDRPPLLHRWQADRHRQQAEGDLRQQVGDQESVRRRVGRGRGHWEKGAGGSRRRAAAEYRRKRLVRSIGRGLLLCECFPAHGRVLVCRLGPAPQQQDRHPAGRPPAMARRLQPAASRGRVRRQPRRSC